MGSWLCWHGRSCRRCGACDGAGVARMAVAIFCARLCCCRAGVCHLVNAGGCGCGCVDICGGVTASLTQVVLVAPSMQIAAVVAVVSTSSSLSNDNYHCQWR